MKLISFFQGTIKFWINPQNVAAIMSSTHKTTTIYTVDGKQYIVEQPIEDVAQRLMS